MAASSKLTTIDQYIAGCEPEIQTVLEQERRTIATAAPLATEAISYGIPTFKLDGKNLVHFAAFTHHIGFYAPPDGHASFEGELSKYKQGKGSVQFPLNQPIPLDLIARMVVRRVEVVRGE